MSAVHGQGTNGRATCGIKIGQKTQTSLNRLNISCMNCLGRIHSDLKLFLEYKESRRLLEAFAHLGRKNKQIPLELLEEYSKFRWEHSDE